jgi:hypothetical protein
MAEEYDLSEEMSVKYVERDDGIEDGIEGELCYIDLFVEYPAFFLPKFAEKIRSGCKLSRDDIIRMIELLNLDNYVLHRAIAIGVHPITGNNWYRTSAFDAVANAERLIARNNKKITVLKNVLKEKAEHIVST